MVRLGIVLSMAGSLGLGLTCRPRPPREPSPIDMPLYPLVDPDGPITKSEQAQEEHIAPRETATCIDRSVAEEVDEAREAEDCPFEGEAANASPAREEN